MLKIARVFLGSAVLVTSLAYANSSTLGNPQMITPNRLKAHLEFVASGLMEGRDTPSRGLDITALYISTQLKLWGVEPGGDNGTYYHNYTLSKAFIDPAKSSLEVNGKTLTYGQHYYGRAGKGTFGGEIVYVGHGYVVPGKGIDPYKGIDVSGKVLLVLNGAPQGTTFRDLRAPGVTSPTEAAKKYGALGVITAFADDSDIATRANQSRGGGGWRVNSDPGSSAIPSIGIGATALETLLTGQSLSASDVRARVDSRIAGPSVALKGTRVLATVGQSGEERRTQNVVGIVRGTDPVLSKEFVVYGAHYDHVGIDQQGNIYYGADDDGSGTTGLMEVAHAFATGQRPKRSIAFVWHSGEEKGLWGSEAFVNRPTIPLKDIVAQINIDMIGRSKAAGDTNPANAVLEGPNGTYTIGPFFTSPELGQTLASVNSELHKMTLNPLYESYNDSERLFFRSDHYNYAKAGIPVVFFFSGLHADYHRPTDTIEKIDFVKQAKVSQTVYALGFRLASDAKRPTFVNNMQGG